MIISFFGTHNRNRTYNCPLGGDCYIHLTMQAYMFYLQDDYIPFLLGMSRKEQGRCVKSAPVFCEM